LDDVKKLLLKMGTRVEASIDKAVKSLTTQNAPLAAL
jgi:hypothetical protein